jgi:hypothetical protein
LGIALKYVREGDVPHIIGKLLTRVTILLGTSPQSKVFTRSLALQSAGNPDFENFEIPNLEVLGENDI